MINKQDYFELISRVSDDLRYLETNSNDKAYFSDFSEHYNNWRRMANGYAKTIEDYNDAVKDFDNLVDKALKKKLTKQFGEDVLKYYHYIDDTKNEIHNKYIRYKIFGFSYTTAFELVDDAEQFIDYMLFVYRTFMNIFKFLPSTERPITDRDLAFPNSYSYMIDYRKSQQQQ